MKKIICLIIVQTLFKWTLAQVQDTIYITVDSSNFSIPYTEKRGIVTISPETLENTVWIITSLNTSITDYKALIAEFEVQDTVQLHINMLLKEVINAQNDHLNDKQETILKLNGLLETSTNTVNLMLKQKESSRKSAAFKQFMGIAGGVIVGLGVGFLVF